MLIPLYSDVQHLKYQYNHIMMNVNLGQIYRRGVLEEKKKSYV